MTIDMLLIYIPAAVLYIVLAFHYTQHMLDNWHGLNRATLHQPWLCLLVFALWPAFYVALITWRLIEPLTPRRQN